MVLACLAAMLSIEPVCEGATRTIPGHVPAIIRQLKPLGRVPETNWLRLAIGLPLRDQPGLTNLLEQLYDSHSSQYRHYLTPAQFTKRFGPAESDYQAVVDFANSNGFTIEYAHTNRVLLDVRARVRDIEHAFHLKLHVYQHPTESRTFMAPDSDPVVSSDLPILHVAGLDDYSKPRPLSHSRPLGGRGIVAASGSGPFGTYGGGDFRAAYAPGVSLTGAGQTLALVELEGYYQSDILAYEASNGLPNVPVSNVLVDDFPGSPGSGGFDSNGIAEASLDIEMAISMAPGLASVIVYETYGSYVDDLFSCIASDNLAQQISCSWGFRGDYTGYGTVQGDLLLNQFFLQMAAQGQSYFNASGDWGAYWDNTNSYAIDNSVYNGDSLLTSPYITLVGGTTLTTDGPGGPWISEVVWNEATEYGTNPAGYSSSGAVSGRYTIPAWQSGIDMSGNGGSTTMRNTPDVSMVADGVYVIYNNGDLVAGDGTSVAAPLWAAFTALVNEQAAINGQPPVGFINPAVYEIGQGTNYLACFNDITVGNNTNSYCPTNFFAVPGYDLCTGWGTPTGTNLINALAPPSDLRVFPRAGFTAANGPAGGPFNVSSEAFTLSNAANYVLSWSATCTAGWLTISPNNGVLSPGGNPANLMVSLSSGAVALPQGTYSATVVFSNLNTGSAITRTFSVLSGQPLVQNGGFETGDFTGWNLSGSFVHGGTLNSIVTNPSHSGNYAARLYSGWQMNGPAPILSQAVPTEAGNDYLLSIGTLRMNTSGATRCFGTATKLYHYQAMTTIGQRQKL